MMEIDQTILEEDAFAAEDLEQIRSELRRKCKQARKALAPEERAEKSLRTVRRICESPVFREAKTVMIYAAMGAELSLDELPAQPEAAGKRFCYPLCVSETKMIPMVPGAWKTGAYGIREPVREKSEEVSPEEIDLVLCPCTAFDAQCNRMGMGGGYYDRFLPKCVNALAAMTAYEVQKASAVPVNDWDRPADAVFTEDAVYVRDPSQKERFV